MINILLSKSAESKVLYLKSDLDAPSGYTSLAKLYIRSVSDGANYEYTLSAAERLIFEASGQVMISCADLDGSAIIDGVIDDGYYDVTMEATVYGSKQELSTQSFAVINKLRALFYGGVNAYDVDSPVHVLQHVQKLNLIMNTLEILGENPGNNTDFWKKYNYVKNQVE